MDEKLIRWARAVKARTGSGRRLGQPGLPPLWVFSDRERLPDPAAALRRLPRGLCGLVLRPGIDPAAVRRAVAVCRARRFAVVAVGGWPRAGRHFPRHEAIMRHGAGLLTASAHDAAELVRARRARVDCVFLSPAYATSSHPGAAALGARRWSGLARLARVPVVALGGVTGANVARLSHRRCAGAAVIGAALGRVVAAAPQCSTNAMTSL